jgi:hypothetical protein
MGALAALAPRSGLGLGPAFRRLLAPAGLSGRLGFSGRGGWLSGRRAALPDSAGSKAAVAETRLRWTGLNLYVFDNTINKDYKTAPISLASPSPPRDEWSCQRNNHDRLPLPPL